MSDRKLVISLVGRPLAEEFTAQAADALRRDVGAAGIAVLLAEAYLRGARGQQELYLGRRSERRETQHGTPGDAEGMPGG